MNRYSLAPLFYCAGLLLATGFSAHAADSKLAVEPAGNDKTLKTKTLELGAKALQESVPLAPFDIYLVGFHPMKDNPAHQMEAHHYCRQVNEDFAQCVLFDGNAKTANLTGIEYIISERLFENLPPQEKEYWHPHNYEILSGQLVAPGLPAFAEKSLMKSKMNSYGKTWHVWNTGMLGQGGDKLPMGDPMLAWSFNHDNEAVPEMVNSRDRRMKTNTAQKRKERADLQKLAKPQAGVDVIKAEFTRSAGVAPPGVKDKVRIVDPAAMPKPFPKEQQPAPAK